MASMLSSSTNFVLDRIALTHDTGVDSSRDPEGDAVGSGIPQSGSSQSCIPLVAKDRDPVADQWSIQRKVFSLSLKSSVVLAGSPYGLSPALIASIASKGPGHEKDESGALDRVRA